MAEKAAKESEMIGKGLAERECVVVRICSRQLKIACNSGVSEEVGFRWRSATVVSPTEKAKPTLLLDLEPSVKQRIRSENELVICWRWEQ